MRNSKYVSRYFNVPLQIEVRDNSERGRGRTKREKQIIEFNIWIMETLKKGENEGNNKEEIINKKVRGRFAK